MYFDTVEVAPLMTNCYLLGDESEKLCAVVDPGGSPDRVLSMIARSGMTPAMILLTHGHFDHVGGVADVLAKYPELPVYCHEKELLPTGRGMEQFFFPHAGANQRTYGEGDELKLGELTVNVLHTPGHSGGSVTLLVQDLMLCGINWADWEYADGYYYYKKAVESGAETAALFETVSFSPSMGNEFMGRTMQLKVIVEATQVGGNGSGPMNAVWR